MRRMRSRQRTWAGVIQICWIAPGPSIAPKAICWPGSMRTDGEIFQPRPRPRAWMAPVPSVAIPPPPFSPVKFSGLIERDLASERRERLPRFIPSPEKRSTIVCDLRLLDAAGLDRFDDAFLEHHEHRERRQRDYRGSGHDVVPGAVILLTETRDRHLHHPEVLIGRDGERPKE